MNLLSRLFYRAKAPNVLIERLASVWEVSRGRLRNAKYSEYVKAYTSWVYAAASRNASAVAQIPLKLYVAKPNTTGIKTFPTGGVPQRQLEYMSKSPTVGRYVHKAVEIEEILEHPFIDLMKNINPHANQFDTIETMILFLELTGNAYWYVVKGQMNVPVEIWTLPAHEMTIIPSKKDFIAKFIYKKDMPTEQVFQPEEIIQFKYPNPLDPYYGCGPLKAAAHAVDLNQYMVDHETALLENRAVPDTIITASEGMSLTEPQIKSLKEQFEANYRGPRKRGKFAFLQGIDIKRLALTPKEMNYLLSRKAQRDEIAAIFGVPLSLLTTEDVNRANAEMGEYTYKKNTILPRILRIEQKLNERLLPMFDEKLFIAFDNPVPDDKEYRLKELETHLGTKYSSVNEERQIDGKEPVEWGEEPIMPVSPFGGLGMGGNDDDDDKQLSELVEKIVTVTLKKKAKKQNGL